MKHDELKKIKPMTYDDLKHALISLMLGILTMACMQLVNGMIHLMQQWMVAGAAGTAATVSYLRQIKYV